MEEAPENGKEFPHSAHANGMNGQCLTVDTTNTFKKLAFCWFLLHFYTTMHGSKNVNLSRLDNELILAYVFIREKYTLLAF